MLAGFTSPWAAPLACKSASPRATSRATTRASASASVSLRTVVSTSSASPATQPSARKGTPASKREPSGSLTPSRSRPASSSSGNSGEPTHARRAHSSAKRGRWAALKPSFSVSGPTASRARQTVLVAPRPSSRSTTSRRPRTANSVGGCGSPISAELSADSRIPSTRMSVCLVLGHVQNGSLKAATWRGWPSAQRQSAPAAMKSMIRRAVSASTKRG
jgi:hypothetical protein